MKWKKAKDVPTPIKLAGQALRKAREAKGLSQRELAKALHMPNVLNCSQTKLSAIEKGLGSWLSFEQWLWIADVLDDSSCLAPLNEALRKTGHPPIRWDVK